MAENEKKIRFGVVGAGKLGGFHSKTLSTMPGVTLVGISDPDLVRAQGLAWEHNCVAYKSHEELFGQVDALIVAAPTEYHAEIGIKALEAGVNILMEKPITNSEEGARKLLELAEKNKVVLQVGHSERFNSAVVETLKHVKNPRYVTIERLGPYDPRVAATGVTLDLMIHDLDIILTMIDSEVESFEAIGASVLSNHEDIANVRLKFKSGCVADITASRATMEASPHAHLPAGRLHLGGLRQRPAKDLQQKNSGNPEPAGYRGDFPEVGKETADTRGDPPLHRLHKDLENPHPQRGKRP